MQKPKPLNVPSGLTLVEVLVAIAITAIAIMAALQLIQATASGLRESKLRALALLCLDNDIVRIQINADSQPLLPSSKVCVQDGMLFRVEIRVLATPHPNFRRIEAQAFASNDSKPIGQIAQEAAQAKTEPSALLAQRVYFRSSGF